MKYNKSPKHIKCLYAIQKSQIKWDRLKEDVFFSRKEHLINYWWHSWISQDFSPLGRRVIWFTSKKLAFICSRTSPLKHYVFNNVIMLQLQKVFSLKKEKGFFSLCFLCFYGTIRQAWKDFCITSSSPAPKTSCWNLTNLGSNYWQIWATDIHLKTNVKTS